MISIDTSTMRELVAAATTANNAITDAMETLESISTHNDWGCKERDAINDYTMTNKTRIRRIQEDASAFLSALSGSASDFDSAESAISEMFSTVENMISSILSITANAVNAVTNTGNISGIISEVTPIVMPIVGPGGGIVPITDVNQNPVLTTAMEALMGSKMDGFNPFETFTYTNVLDPIPLCNFSDVNFR